jgi:hypothetical protein
MTAAHAPPRVRRSSPLRRTRLPRYATHRLKQAVRRTALHRPARSVRSRCARAQPTRHCVCAAASRGPQPLRPVPHRSAQPRRHTPASMSAPQRAVAVTWMQLADAPPTPRHSRVPRHPCLPPAARPADRSSRRHRLPSATCRYRASEAPSGRGSLARATAEGSTPGYAAETHPEERRPTPPERRSRPRRAGSARTGSTPTTHCRCSRRRPVNRWRR